MTLNTLFLPLLGGFLFLVLFNGTSHRALVQPAQVRLLWSATIGLPLLLLARAMVVLFERTQQPEPIQNWLVFAIGVPLACSMIAGCAIWFATHAIQGTSAAAHKPKSVLGLVVIVLAVAFLFRCTIIPDAPKLLVGLDFRLYILSVLAAMLWGSLSYARFGAIRWGAALIRISTVMMLIAAAMYYTLQYEHTIVEFWQSLIKPMPEGVTNAGLGSAFTACVLGLVGAWLANVVYTKDVAEARYVLGKGSSQLERLFFSADSRRSMVLLTMDDGKVYVGMVKRVAMRGNADPYIVIYPAISGYRTQTKEVAFTTFYQGVYDRLGEEAWEQFQKVLSMRRIVSATYYDQHHHDTFFGLKIMVPPQPRGHT